LHGIVNFIPLHGILKVSQKMKKVFALLTIVSVLSFVACKNDTKKSQDADSTANQEQVDADKAEAEKAQAEETETPTEVEVTDSTATMETEGTKVEIKEDGVKVETK